MMFASTAGSPNDIEAFACDTPTIETLEVDSEPSNSRTFLPNTNAKNTNEVSAVYYGPEANRETQMSQHTLVRYDDTKRLSQVWRNKVEIFEPYFAYCDEILDILIKFQSLQYRHLDRTNVTKRPIELLDDHTQPVHSAPYGA